MPFRVLLLLRRVYTGAAPFADLTAIGAAGEAVSRLRPLGCQTQVHLRTIPSGHGPMMPDGHRPTPSGASANAALRTRICRASDRHARCAVASVCARRRRHTPLRRSVARLCRPNDLGRVLPRLTRRGVALAKRGQRGRAGSRSHTCCATGHSLRSTCLAWRVGRPSRSVDWLGRRGAVGKSGEPGRCRGRPATRRSMARASRPCRAPVLYYVDYGRLSGRGADGTDMRT